MKEVQRLTWKQLESAYPPSDFSFKTTDDLEFLEDIIGQERAKKAMEFGLSVKAQGYNIYISGEPGTGKTTLAKVYAQKSAKQEARGNDWCYVYNFKEKRVPKALCFAPGDGRRFKNDMTELIAYLTKEIPYMYSGQNHKKQKSDILKQCEKRQQESIEQLQEQGENLGFSLTISNGGISFAALDEQGNPITKEIYESLGQEKQFKIESASKILEDIVDEIIQDVNGINQVAMQEIEDIEYQMGLESIGYYIKTLKEKYHQYDQVIEYLKDLQEDILDNVDVFIEGQEEEKSPMNLLFMTSEKKIEKLVRKYDVNLLVDNGDQEGAPVIIASNCECNKILGELEYDNESGSLSTDYMKIKAGLFHQANGGYLILQIEDLLSSYEGWNNVKKILLTKKLSIENIKGNSVTSVATLRPEPIPIDVKVILIGSFKIYHLLYEADPEFKKLFKIRADFDSTMDNNQNNVKFISRFIKTFCQKHALLPFSAGAVRVVIRQAARRVEDPKKITTEFSWISNLLIEANAYATFQGFKIVDQNHVQQAIDEKKYRESRYEEKLEEQIMSDTIMIDTKGNKVGQVNGLTIIHLGENRFGQPMKITATTYKGRAGIVNVEKECKLSGPIHTKGSQVIAGYLGQTYAQNNPLSVSCRICLEQNYGMVDGDSASSAELCSIISSLSGLALKQNIAITGSVNQHGVMQPIGGVTYKIEGFFKICKKRGLTGDQGVIIPEKNAQDLVLNNEVIEAVKNKLFHIYTISNIEEGLEILTGKPREQIRQQVELKLKNYNLNTAEG